MGVEEEDVVHEDQVDERKKKWCVRMEGGRRMGQKLLQERMAMSEWEMTSSHYLQGVEEWKIFNTLRMGNLNC